jgi:tRNA A37 threonylcarbamoyladenosine synthetase subunit TsaC/SUA5/YrdC
MRIFGNQLDLVIDGGPRSGGRPSTLVDVSAPRARLLRRGAIELTAEFSDIEDATGGTD